MQRKGSREGVFLDQTTYSNLQEEVILSSTCWLIRSEPSTSPFFSRPNGVVQRISQTILNKCFK